MSEHGGARLGAGRKPGAKNVKTQEVAIAAAEAGVTPLEIMLARMRELWTVGEKDAAVLVAKDAAPYIHAKPRPLAEKEQQSDMATVSIAQLEQIFTLMQSMVHMPPEHQQVVLEIGSSSDNTRPH